ncbi:hypothetical protein BC830DRAFT_95220 [Chytriomyces sp. MP71]|nr:hypothetical protein BC830DRAFT_95220 [Chytriomyces sp. MP71]
MSEPLFADFLYADSVFFQPQLSQSFALLDESFQLESFANEILNLNHDPCEAVWMPDEVGGETGTLEEVGGSQPLASEMDLATQFNLSQATQLQHQQLQQYPETPSPLLPYADSPFNSPFSTLHFPGTASSPPLTPATCLPLSVVAPSSVTPFFFDGTFQCMSPHDAELALAPAPFVPTVSITLPSSEKRAYPLLKKITLKRFNSTETSPSPIPACSPAATPISPLESSFSFDDTPVSGPDSCEESGTFSKSLQSLKMPVRSHSDPVYSPRKPKKVSSSSSKDHGNPKKRHILQQSETALLNDVFDETPFLNAAQAQDLAKRLNMSVSQIRVWFQNKRAATKRQKLANAGDDE